MAKFLTTTGTSFYIEQIIINATKSLTLVTPYLKLSRNLVERISDADREGIKITVVYGKSELAHQERRQLFALKNIQIYFCENLHAKCFFNDDTMIVTSMNLYEFSERNNREMGILIELDNDADIFGGALKEVESIKNASRVEKRFAPENDDKAITVPVNALQNPTNVEDLVLEIDPNYNNLANYHLPAISKLLKIKYPTHTVELTEDSVIVSSFPVNGVDLNISHRLYLDFDTSLSFDYIKNQNGGAVVGDLSGIRFYWNQYSLTLYLPRHFTSELTIDGLKLKVDMFMRMIDTVYANLQLK